MDRRDRIAQAALAHADCSALQDTARYVEIVVREADRDPMKLAYYTRNPTLSTCALVAVGALRLAGCVEPECVAPYVGAHGALRDAFVDAQQLARRFDAWVSGALPIAAMLRGDVFVVVRSDGSDGHMGVVVGDAVATAAGWSVETVEGGQWDGRGSSAIRRFARAFSGRAGKLWLDGERYVLGYASAERMPVPDSNDVTGDGQAAIGSSRHG